MNWGHWDLLTSKILSAERFLKNRNTFHNTEKEILRFLRIYIQTPDPAGKNKVCEDSLTEFRKLFQDPEEGIFLSYFDLISWVEAKLEGTSFAEKVRGKG